MKLFKASILTGVLLLAACDHATIKDRCSINLEATGYKQLGYFEGTEAHNYLIPINIKRDHAQEPTINLEVFTLWVRDSNSVALLLTGCRVIAIDYAEALRALMKRE